MKFRTRAEKIITSLVRKRWHNLTRAEFWNIIDRNGLRWIYIDWEGDHWFCFEDSILVDIKGDQTFYAATYEQIPFLSPNPPRNRKRPKPNFTIKNNGNLIYELQFDK